MSAREVVDVVIVEDSERDYQSTRDLLLRASEYRFVVRWVGSREAALAELSRGEADVWLVDYDLQGASGVALIREARANGAMAPMILLSGHDASMCVDMAEDPGVDGCLSKWHLTPALLQQSVRHAVARRRLVTRTLELERRVAALGRQVGTVAHDFNNMITAIVCEAEHLKRTFTDDDPRHTGVQEIIVSSARAAALARQLVLTTREQSLPQRDIDVNEVVAGVQRLLKRIVGGRAQVGLNLSDDALVVCGDVHQMEQVVVNLVANARDATAEGGHIKITTHAADLDQRGASSVGVAEGEYVVLSVEDDGSGMSEEVRARLFEPFFTTKAPDEGTGLGLVSALDIVTRSGGAIRVLSVPGVGSRFDVYLPRVGCSGLAA